jgi:hypothetical protein
MNTDINAGAPPTVRAVELCKYFTLSDGGKQALKPEMMPDQFAGVLAEKDHHPDAIQLLAHYLPKRQAVFWAVTCVKQVAERGVPEVDNAIAATERWIADPTEENRKAALKAADAGDAGTPAGCAALAAFYAEGLPRTEDAKQNARAHFLTSKLVAAAVLLAATADDHKMKERFAAFVSKGMEIVQRVRKN